MHGCVMLETFIKVFSVQGIVVITIGVYLISSGRGHNVAFLLIIKSKKLRWYTHQLYICIPYKNEKKNQKSYCINIAQICI